VAKSPDAFRTISEVAEWLDTPAHVLRFWESRFTQVKPVKRAGGRRYYRPGDMRLLGGIKKLLHDDGMTIKGVQKMLRTEGIKKIAALSQPIDPGDDNTPSSDIIDITPTAVKDTPAPQEPDIPQAPPAPTESIDPVEPDLFAALDAPVPTPPTEPVVTPRPAASATTAAPRASTDSDKDSDKKAAITEIYSRLCALHDRMKAAIDPAQQG